MPYSFGKLLFLFTISILGLASPGSLIDIPFESQGYPDSLRHTANISELGAASVTASDKSVGAFLFSPEKKDSANKTVGQPNSVTTKQQNIIITGVIQNSAGYHEGADKVEFYSAALNKGYTTRSDNSGYFQLDNVPPAADYQLSVTPKGMFRRHSQKHVLVSMEHSQFNIILDVLPLEVLAGIVVNAEGYTVPNLRLKIRSEEKSRWEAHIVTDSIGQFSVSDVPVGGIIFSSMIGQTLSTRGYQLGNKGQIPLTLIVDHGANSVVGYVYDQFNVPIPGANIILGWGSNDNGLRTTAYRRTATNMEGSFSVSGVGPGIHSLVVADGQLATRQTIDVTNQYTEVIVVLSQDELLN